MEVVTPAAAAVRVGELVLAAILATAGLGKLTRFADWTRATDAYRITLVRSRAGRLIIPVAEVVVAGALVIGVGPAASGAALVMFLIFAVILTLAWARGASGECACLGPVLPATIGPSAVIRAGALATLAAAVVGADLSLTSSRLVQPEVSPVSSSYAHVENVTRE
jgi:uncharacterized membrane protein YphA (DoxX/SURF4 family)